MMNIKLYDHILKQLKEDELDKLISLEMLELDLRLELQSMKYKVNEALNDIEMNGIETDWGSREWMRGKTFKELKNIYKLIRKDLNFLNEQFNRKYTVRKVQNSQPGDYIPF